MSKKNDKKSSGLKSIKGGKDSGSSVGGRSETTGSMDTESMESVGNVRPTNADAAHPTAFSPSKIIDFSKIRAQRNQDNRRNFERHFLQNVVDVYCEIEGGSDLLPVELVEVSESGCSFRVPTTVVEKLPRDTMGEILPLQLRFYMSQDSYMRVGLFAINSTRDIASGTPATRFGCRVDDTFASSEAYRQFVRFMEQFTRHAYRDAKQASGI